MEFFGDKTVIKSITRSDSNEELGRGVLEYVYQGEYAEAVSSMPALLTSDSHFPSTWILQKRDVKYTTSGITVTLTYYPTEPETVDGGEANDPEYNLNKTEQTVSILLHPSYESATDDAKTIAKALIDGADPWGTVYYRVVDGKLEIRKEKPEDGTWTEAVLAEMADKVAETDTVGRELLLKVKSGTTSYVSVLYSWTETVYKNSISTYASNTCKIDSPPGPNPTIDGNWLYLGVSANKTRSDRLWKLTREWRSSDPGAVWDPTLY